MALPNSVLTGSVGVGGVNRNADVALVQKLLNAVPAVKGGPTPALTPDGLCGPKTVGAIRRFQSVNTGVADGRIDPGKRTEQALRTVVEAAGKLAQILGGAGATSAPPARPAQPPPAGAGTPIRQKFRSILQGLLPPPGTLSGGTAPPGAKGTGCGELPGRVFSRVPVIAQGQPGAFKVKVSGVTLFLTSPTTWWEEIAKQIDRDYAPARRCWVPFGGGRPLPGDIYLLGQASNRAMFQHVGIIVDPLGPKWTTADGGQGNGWQSGFVKRDFQPDGLMTGEFGNQAYLKGWVDLDALFAVARSAFPPTL